MEKYLNGIEAELAVYRTHPIGTKAAIAIFDWTVARYEVILRDLRARLGRDLA
jgi:hypothetical protein